jgi:hypothetical protein
VQRFHGNQLLAPAAIPQLQTQQFSEERLAIVCRRRIQELLDPRLPAGFPFLLRSVADFVQGKDRCGSPRLFPRSCHGAASTGAECRSISDKRRRGAIRWIVPLAGQLEKKKSNP